MNKTIGHLAYSLAEKVVNPSEEESEKKIAATLQQSETISLDLLAGHMAGHHSPFSKGTLKGVLTDMVDCIVELLRQGYSVNLDGLARFYLTCTSDFVQYVEQFNPTSHIKRINLRAAVDAAASTAVNSDIEYEYAMTREQQAAAKRAAKAQLPSDQNGNGNGNDNGNTGDNQGEGDDNGEGITG